MIHITFLLKFSMITSCSLWYCGLLHFGKDAPTLRRKKMGESYVVFCVVHSTKAESINFQLKAINVLLGANSKALTFQKEYSWIQLFTVTYFSYLCCNINSKKMFNDDKKEWSIKTFHNSYYAKLFFLYQLIFSSLWC